MIVMSGVATPPIVQGVERWICKHCANTVFLNPHKWMRHARCEECGHDTWHHTLAPEPEV